MGTTKADMKTKLPMALSSEIEALGRIAERAADYPDIVRIVVFGSRVRGDFHGASDLDLLIVVKNLRHRDRVIGWLHNVELDYEVPLSPTMYTLNEVHENERLGSAFFKNIDAEGIIIYDAEQGR